MDPILHHYRGSPYAEKLRLVLGYKAVPWGSLEIPPIPPRDSLRPILGAFRRTPVLQLGADFFCDTRLIAEVIDAMSGERPLDTGHNRALSAAICGWLEPRAFVLTGPVRFQTVDDVHGVFDRAVDAASFQRDRAPFMSPAIEAQRFRVLRDSAQDHLRAYISVIEAALETGHDYIGGLHPTFADFSAYHLIWWLRKPPAQDALLARREKVNAWADRMRAIGHGRYATRSVDDAFNAVRAAQGHLRWQSPWRRGEEHRLGQLASVLPDDYGRDALRGILIDASERHVTIEHAIDSLGTVRVHFPRLGYEVTVE